MQHAIGAAIPEEQFEQAGDAELPGEQIHLGIGRQLRLLPIRHQIGQLTAPLLERAIGSAHQDDGSRFRQQIDVRCLTDLRRFRPYLADEAQLVGWCGIVAPAETVVGGDANGEAGAGPCTGIACRRHTHSTQLGDAGALSHNGAAQDGTRHQCKQCPDQASNFHFIPSSARLGGQDQLSDVEYRARTVPSICT